MAADMVQRNRSNPRLTSKRVQEMAVKTVYVHINSERACLRYLCGTCLNPFIVTDSKHIIG